MKGKKRVSRKVTYGPRPTHGLAVDASTIITNPGPSAYQAADIKTGKKLFYVEIGKSTNNIAEYLAIVHAVLLCLNGKLPYTEVYSDSTIAINWIGFEYTNTKLEFDEDTAYSLQLLYRAKLQMSKLKIKRTNDNVLINNKISLKFWSNKTFGEIPADFGNK